MTPVLVVPGLHGSGEEHWQSGWLRDNPNTILVRQDDWSNPNPEQWMARLESAIAAHPRCLIVAHSLGSILTARLASSPLADRVRGALLVAPADVERTGDLHRRTYDFGTVPVRRLPFPSIAVLSRNDPHMQFSTATSVARAWGSQIIDLGSAGHINVDAGYGRWPASYHLAGQLQARIAA